MDLIVGKRYFFYSCYCDGFPDYSSKLIFALFTGSYSKSGKAILVDRQGNEWNINVKDLELSTNEKKEQMEWDKKKKNALSKNKWY